MSTLSACVLCVCLLGGEPAAPEELQRAVAALEKSLTPPTSLEVQFREYYDWLPEEAKQDYAKNQPAARLCVAQYKPNRLFATSALIKDPTHLLGKTVFDGTHTRSWQHDNNLGQLSPVRINLGPPSWGVGLGLRNLGLILGFVGGENEPRLGRYVEIAKKNQTLTGTRTERGLEISFGPQKVNKEFYTIMVVVDPEHDYRMTSWKQVGEAKLLPDGSKYSDIHSFAIEKFQSLNDEASTTKVWFPVRGHYQNGFGTFRVEVDSVRINPPIPDERFDQQ